MASDELPRPGEQWTALKEALSAGKYAHIMRGTGQDERSAERTEGAGQEDSEGQTRSGAAGRAGSLVGSSSTRPGAEGQGPVDERSAGTRRRLPDGQDAAAGQTRDRGLADASGDSGQTLASSMVSGQRQYVPGSATGRDDGGAGETPSPAPGQEWAPGVWVGTDGGRWIDLPRKTLATDVRRKSWSFWHVLFLIGCAIAGLGMVLITSLMRQSQSNHSTKGSILVVIVLTVGIICVAEGRKMRR
jgi:hypothetical protein